MKKILTYSLFGLLFSSCLISVKKETKGEVVEHNFTNLEYYPIYPGCQNEQDPESCLMVSISDKILDKAKRENLILPNDTLKVGFRIDPDGSTYVLDNETNNAELKIISNSVLNSLPTIEPAYSKKLEEHVSSGYSFYIIIKENERINKL